MSFNAVTVHNNFSRGQLDSDLDGRFDLPIYQSGSRLFRNFISNFKGNAIYRSGLENILKHQNGALVEFRFSLNQNYILFLGQNTMRFLSYDSNGVFGWVLDDNQNILELTTPYTIDEAKEISQRNTFTQNFDSMVICHENHPVYELTRLSANDFSFGVHSRQLDPFTITRASTIPVAAITREQFARFTINNHGYSVGDSFYVNGAVGMTQINGYTCGVIEVVDSNNVRVTINTAATLSNGTDAFGVYQGGAGAQLVTELRHPSVPLYYQSRLYLAATPEAITTIWASAAGNFAEFGIPTTVDDDDPLQFTVAELDSRIEWLFNGQNSLIIGTNNDIVAVNGGQVGEAISATSINVNTTDAEGSAAVAPIAKDALVFYVSNDRRNLLYFNYDLLSETFVARDANLLAYQLTLGGITKLRHARNREDLIFAIRGDGRFLTCNFSESENIIGWHEHGTNGLVRDIAQISNNEGEEQMFFLTERNGEFFIERQQEYKDFSERGDFFSGEGTNEDTARALEAEDDQAFYRTLAEEFKECIFVDNARVVSNLQTSDITFNPLISRIEVSGATPFTPADVGKDIVYKTKTGYESGRFQITQFITSSLVEVEVLQEPTTNEYNQWYLTFSTIGGLDDFNNQEVAVVADGGFLDVFTPTDGTIDLTTQFTSVVVGYKYRGIIQSFTLGFQLQGDNTQINQKALNRVGLRFYNTAGIRFGSNAYRLDPVQMLRQTDLNYLPPLPMNGTQDIRIADTLDRDKAFVLVQDQPLPATITAIILGANYEQYE